MKEIEKILFKVIRLNRPLNSKEKNIYFIKLKADKHLIIDISKKEILLLNGSSKDKKVIDIELINEIKQQAIKYNSTNWLDILK